MKKLFYLAAVAAIALTSCDREKDFNDRTSLDKDAIAFSLQSAATRAADAVSTETQGISMPVAKLADGIDLYMEETITDLNYAAETRGTPVYTENVGYLYKDLLGVYAEYGTKGVDASYTRLENSIHQYGENGTQKGWIFKHEYDEDIWGNGEVQFYLRMPSDMTGHGVTSVASASGVTTVSYTSPVTAASQEDLIFGGVKMDREEYLGHLKTKGGAPVTLYHALTGIKFALANEVAELANIQITKISFIGLVNKGSFTFNAASPSQTAFTWTSTETVEKNVIYQDYVKGDLVTYGTDDGNNFAESFYEAGAKQNINDAAATKTFWLIPQSITGSKATLKIEYTMNGADEFIEIELGDLKASNWQAGQLRTYTFKIDEVNLKIRDDVEIKGSASDGYKGSIKNNVKITNTGNTPAFIRASIVGQWVDANNDPVFGFTDEINQLYIVESWYEDQFVTKPGATAPARKHGTFVDLSGYDQDNGYNNWVLCKDGYYYYTLAVDPVDPDVSGSGVTEALFTSYTVGTMPKASLGGVVLEGATMHFELEIATQAIKANKLDGTPNNWDEAWKEALGAKPQQ